MSVGRIAVAGVVPNKRTGTGCRVAPAGRSIREGVRSVGRIVPTGGIAPE